jgi:maltose operon periplasmic protein
VLIALLGGCHSVKELVPPNFRPPENPSGQLDLAKKALQDATPCCTSFADFSYQNQLPWSPKKFELGPGSSVFSLNGQRSYFLSFRLPADGKLPYRVGLKSELNGRWLRSSYLFAPTLVLLDEAFQPVGDQQDVNLCEHVGWSSDTTGAFGSFEIKDPKARYVVVFSSAAQQAANTYWEQSPAAFSAEAPVNMSAAGSFKIPHGPDGVLWVGMMDKAYASAVDNAVCGKAPEGEGVLKTLRDVIPVPLWSDSSSNSAKTSSNASPTDNGSSGNGGNSGGTKP